MHKEDERIDYYFSFKIYPLLRKQAQKIENEFYDKHRRPMMKSADLYPTFEDYGEDLFCLDLAKGDVMLYERYMNDYNFADLVEIHTLRLISEYRDD